MSPKAQVSASSPAPYPARSAPSAPSDVDQGPALTGPAGAPREPESAEPSLTSGRRHEMLVTLAIVGGLLGVVAAGSLARRLARHPSREQCAAMLDRYAEQEARAKAPSGPLPAHPPPDDTSADRCAHELTAEEVDCAMKASSIDEIERCLP